MFFGGCQFAWKENKPALVLELIIVSGNQLSSLEMALNGLCALSIIRDLHKWCLIGIANVKKHVQVSTLKQIDRSTLKIPYLPTFPDRDRQTLFVVMKVSY